MFLLVGCIYPEMLYLMSPCFPLHPFILMLVHFSAKKFFFFLHIFGLLIMGATTIVLTNVMIFLLVLVFLLCLCRSLEKTVLKMTKISKIWLVLILYFMLRKETKLAQMTKKIWRRLPPLHARRSRITRPHPPRIKPLMAPVLDPGRATPVLPRQLQAGPAAGPNPPRPARQRQTGPAAGPDPLRITRASSRGRVADPLRQCLQEGQPHQKPQDPLRI